ncbi:nuclear transport factor 2 family protein [Streptomyces zhihengii]|uniref:nuclear transport factor 2 family protein n=1 Tax=Streptomyces zhihengii TaxID=1818004 RepID=UPI0036C365CC
MTDVHAEGHVRALIGDLYAALGDWDAFARRLDPRVTVWESDADGMLHGTGQVDALRTRRRAGLTAATVPLSVTPEDLLVDTWQDGAVARYVLRAAYPGHLSDQCYRVTDVLRRSDAGWHIVHHHSEALPREPAAAPGPRSTGGTTPPQAR